MFQMFVSALGLFLVFAGPYTAWATINDAGVRAHALSLPTDVIGYFMTSAMLSGMIGGGSLYLYLAKAQFARHWDKPAETAMLTCVNLAGLIAIAVWAFTLRAYGLAERITMGNLTVLLAVVALIVQCSMVFYWGYITYRNIRK